MLRYLFAFATASILVTGGLLFARYWRYPEGYDYQVTPAQMRLLLMADALKYFWFFWIPIVCALCFAVAHFSGFRERK